MKWILENRLRALKIVSILGLFSSMLITLPLWHSQREYPTVPVFEWLSFSNFYFDAVLLILTFVFLTYALFKNKKRYLILGLLGLTVLLLLDQSRLMPWLIHYFVIFFLIVVSKFEVTALDTSKLFIALIYIWAGIQKLSVVFVFESFPRFIDGFAPFLAASDTHTLFFFGALISVIEICIGFGLLTKRFKNAAIVGAFAMMVFVLVSLITTPEYNSPAVWPWNVALFLSVLILFLRSEKFKIPNHWSANIVVVLFGLAPILSLGNSWDSYPSWVLYNGRADVAAVVVPRSEFKELPFSIQKTEPPLIGGKYYFGVHDWSYETMNVVPYPEPRVYKKVFQTLCDYSDELYLTHIYYPHFLSQEPVRDEYRCSELAQSKL